jgi:hypothetical protein
VYRVILGNWGRETSKLGPRYNLGKPIPKDAEPQLKAYKISLNLLIFGEYRSSVYMLISVLPGKVGFLTLNLILKSVFTGGLAFYTNMKNRPYLSRSSNWQ